MVGELQVPIIAAGAAALAAINDLEQIPMQAGLIRPEPPHQLRDIKDCTTLTAEAVNGQARAGGQLASQSAF